jgi:hypothetical protein
MRNRTAVILFCLLAAGFLGGMYRLFALRFQQGDIFPPYSSLRADPLGCKGLAEAVGELPGLTVSRNHLPLSRLKGSSGRTILYLGADRGTVAGGGDFKELKGLAREGNRVIVALSPADRDEEPCGGKEDAKPEKDKPAAGEKPEKATKVEKPAVEETGVTVRLLPKGEGENPPRALLAAPAPELPPFLPLRSRLVLKSTDPQWRPVYAAEGDSTVLERREGRGSIVLLSDSYLLSNEALRREHPAKFVAWLLGPTREVVFDEGHLGISESAGVMTLVRKFRLLPLLGSLVILAGLFVWKNGVPFAADPSGAPAEVGGRDRFSGTVSLLRRHVPRERLASVLLAEWRKSFARDLPGLGDIPQRMEEAAESAGPAEAAERYSEMARILSERKKI